VEAPPGTGTVVNLVTVTVGGLIGLRLRHRLPDGLRQTVLAALGLFTIVLGVKDAIAGELLVVGASLLLGVVVGELVGVEAAIERFGAAVERRFKGPDSDGGLARGFVLASILYCVGPLTLMGCFDDGVRGDPTKLVTKAMLDGFAAVPLAATLGAGVLLSLGTIVLIQGGLTAIAFLVEPLLSSDMLAQGYATGGVLVMAIGLNLMEIKKIRVANFLPALLFAPVIARFGPDLVAAVLPG